MHIMDGITVCGSLPVYVKIVMFFVSALGSYFRTEVISPWLLPFLDAMSLHTYAFPDMMTFESGVLVLNCTRSTPHAPGCSELFRPMGNKCRELRVFIDIKFKETWLRDEPTCVRIMCVLWAWSSNHKCLCLPL